MPAPGLHFVEEGEEEGRGIDDDDVEAEVVVCQAGEKTDGEGDFCVFGHRGEGLLNEEVRIRSAREEERNGPLLFGIYIACGKKDILKTE